MHWSLGDIALIVEQVHDTFTVARVHLVNGSICRPGTDYIVAFCIQLLNGTTLEKLSGGTISGGKTEGNADKPYSGIYVDDSTVLTICGNETQISGYRAITLTNGAYLDKIGGEGSVVRINGQIYMNGATINKIGVYKDIIHMENISLQYLTNEQIKVYWKACLKITDFHI